MSERSSLRAAGIAVPSGLPGKGRSSMRSALEVFWKRKFFVVAFFLIVFVALCAYHYDQSLQTASTVLSLDYEQASRGLTPNQTRFNIFEIQSDEVMQRLIQSAGLEGKITPDELSECISVKATHGRNVSGSVNYISTSFVVRFTNDGVIAARSAEDMLALLCRAYREYFVEHYGYNITKPSTLWACPYTLYI